MNENSPSDEDAVAVEQLKMIAGQMTEEDFQREQPPADLWGEIAAQMDRPVNEVVTLRHNRRRALFVAAAVAAAAVALVVGLVVRDGGRDDVVASASLSNDGLSPLGSASSGTAEIIRRDGSYLLHLDVNHVPQEPSSYTEVWLIDTQVNGMISLGPFHGNGDYVIPSGVNPADYPIIDVSIEPSDGVPTHSGVSIVRGVAAA